MFTLRDSVQSKRILLLPFFAAVDHFLFHHHLHQIAASRQFLKVNVSSSAWFSQNLPLLPLYRCISTWYLPRENSEHIVKLQHCSKKLRIIAFPASSKEEIFFKWKNGEFSVIQVLCRFFVFSSGKRTTFCHLRIMQILNAARADLLCYWVAILLLGMFRFAHAACVPPGGCSVALAYYVFNTSIDGNLSTIASRFQAREKDILWYSGLNTTSAVSLESGQALQIPFVCGCASSFLGHNFSYSVVQNDLASTIANEKYGFLTTVGAMTDANQEDLDFIYPDNILKIPVNCSCGDPNVNSSLGLFLTYVAEENDNAASLSKKFGVSSALLQSYNPTYNLNILQQNVDIVFIPVKDGNGVYPPFNSTGLGSNNSNKNIIVGASVAAAIFLIMVMGAVLFYVCVYRPKKRKKATEMIKYQAAEAPLTSALSSGAGRLLSEASTVSTATAGTASSGLSLFSPDRSVEFTYKELADATDNFSIAKKIGQGGYGSVYYAEIHGQKLAIKMMNMQATKEFLAELKVLTRVHHTNLVRLVGYCTEGSLFLVYEYVENGTLSQHLKYPGREGSTPLPWATRVQIALDAARGLEYIHEHTTPTYIHRDIKSSNILLDKSCHAKVADFGLTKLTESANASSTIPSRLVGTFGYMAPEYARFGDISAKADVYSFGVVLFELITAKEAIVHQIDKASATQAGSHGLVTLFDEVLNDLVNGKEKLGSLVDPALGEDYPLESVWKMATLAGACTREEPLLRPNMRVVVVALMTLSSSQDWEADHGMEGFFSGR